MSKIFYISFFVLTFSSCSHDQNNFDFTVTTNQLVYEKSNSDIVSITIEGGLNKALIYPIIASYNVDGTIDEYTTLNYQGGETERLGCCSINHELGFSSGLVCNCNLESLITSYSSNLTFFETFKSYKVLIIDPYVSSSGRQTLASARTPSNNNIICESEVFSFIDKLEFPILEIDCSSMSQLSDFSTYPIPNNNNDFWRVKNSGGIDLGPCFEANHRGGHIEFTVTLEENATMRYWNYQITNDYLVPEVVVDALYGPPQFVFSIVPNSYSASNYWFTQYESDFYFEPGTYTVLINFGGPYSGNFYSKIDNIQFFSY